MPSHLRDRSPARLRGVGVALLAAGVLILSTHPGRAAAPAQTDSKPAAPTGVLKDSAVAKVPADAAFFASSMRNKEQLDLFTKSQAYKTLRKVPIVELAGKFVQSKLRDEDSPLRPLFDLYEQDQEKEQDKDGKQKEQSKEEKEQQKKAKENKELVDLLLASASDEVFVYGGKGWNDLLLVVRKVFGSGLGGLLGDLVGFDFFNAPRSMGKEAILEAQKNREMLRVPDLVIGMKAKDAKKIDAHLKRLEPELKKLADQNPMLKDRVKREGAFLTLQLDGSLVPWDDLDLSEFVEKKEDIKDLLDHLKKATLVLSVGVKDDYVLFALTSSVKDLEKFGKGPGLAQRKELQPLAKHASKKVTAIGYASKEFLDNSVGLPDWDGAGKGVKRLVEKGVKKEDLKKDINKDIDGLTAELKKRKTGWGTIVACNILTKDGYEAFVHDYAKCDHLKGVNTRLLDHTDGDPIFAAAFGFKVDGSTYAMFSKYVRALYGHGESAFLNGELDDNVKDEYKRAAAVVLPAFRELDDTLNKQLMPALKGESGLGIVIDRKWKSKRWHTSMPELKRPLPMFELGLLLGIKDEDKFADAMKGARTGLEKLVTKVGEATGQGQFFGEFKLEAPKKQAVRRGTLYTWEVAKDSGLDEQFAPTAGVGKGVAVLALSKSHAEGLLRPSKMNVGDGPLSVKRDLVGGAVFNMAALVDLVMAWADVVPDLIPGDDDVAKFIRKQAIDTIRQVKEIGTVMKCVKQGQAATYLNGGKLTTHVRLVIQDLEESPEPPRKR